MDRDEILDKIEDIQENVDNMNFQGSQEAELWLREGIADYVLELVNNLSQHLVISTLRVCATGCNGIVVNGVCNSCKADWR